MLLKVVYLILSILALSMGVLYLFAPDALMKLSAWADKVVFTDRQTFIHRKISGILLLAAGVLFLTLVFK